MASTIDAPAIAQAVMESSRIILRLPTKNGTYSNKEFWELCKLNPELRLEKKNDGSVVIMNPTLSDSGRQDLNIAALLWIWARQDGTGVAFSSSTGFTLPTSPESSVRSPDASWIKHERWNALSEKAKLEEFAPIVPDFIVELKSRSDALRELREKMREYMKVGVRLAWLIDPETRSVEIYRPGKEVERLENADSVSGDPELPGFVLDLKQVW